MRRLPLATIVCFLALATPAQAIDVVFGDDDGDKILLVADTTGIDDTLTVRAAADASEAQVAGPNVVAGPGCEQREPAVVVCSNPGGQAFTIGLALGAGDDTATLEPSTAPFTIVAEGGEGNDTIRGHGNLAGGPGNDVLEVVNAVTGAKLEGGEGDDRLIASHKAASLGGGLGADVLAGGAGNDVLVDVGDFEGDDDRISCGGGKDLVERDRGDVVSGCPRSATDDIARVKHRWAVYGGGYTYNKLLRITLPAIGQSGLATALLGEIGAICQGKGCGRARFRTQARGLNPPKARFLLRSGGVRIPGTKLRGFKTGAKIVVLYRIELSGIEFVKGVQFTIRHEKLPKVDTGCAVKRPGETEYDEFPCA